MTFLESLNVDFSSNWYKVFLNQPEYKKDMFLMLNDNCECLCVWHKGLADGARGVSWSY